MKVNTNNAYSGEHRYSQTLANSIFAIPRPIALFVLYVYQLSYNTKVDNSRPKTTMMAVATSVLSSFISFTYANIFLPNDKAFFPDHFFAHLPEKFKTYGLEIPRCDQKEDF